MAADVEYVALTHVTDYPARLELAPGDTVKRSDLLGRGVLEHDIDYLVEGRSLLKPADLTDEERERLVSLTTKE